MALVRVFSPDSESELLVAAALLEGHDIPAFIHNRGIGSILPGVQINAYNTQSILVPEDKVADAVELLEPFKRPPRAAIVPLQSRDRLRVLLEWLLFGWFVPGSRPRAADIQAGDDA